MTTTYKIPFSLDEKPQATGTIVLEYTPVEEDPIDESDEELDD